MWVGGRTGGSAGGRRKKGRKEKDAFCPWKSIHVHTATSGALQEVESKKAVDDLKVREGGRKGGREEGRGRGGKMKHGQVPLASP